MADETTTDENDLRHAMQDRARLDIVTVLSLAGRPAVRGVKVSRHSLTPKGNDKWTPLVTIIPRDNQTLADVLRDLGELAEATR